METGTEDRCDYGQSIQRFAHRTPAQTTRRVANSLRHFAQPETRIRSRAAAQPPRRRRHEASREMDGFSGAADRHAGDAGPWAGKFLRRWETAPHRKNQAK